CACQTLTLQLQLLIQSSQACMLMMRMTTSPRSTRNDCAQIDCVRTQTIPTRPRTPGVYALTSSPILPFGMLELFFLWVLSLGLSLYVFCLLPCVFCSFYFVPLCYWVIFCLYGESVLRCLLLYFPLD